MFRTELQLQPALKTISLKDSILLIGSCFSNTIGDLLVQNKFNALVNPFGTLFNPISINKLLSSSINNSGLSESGFDSNGDVHFHYDLHSDFSALDKTTLVNKADDAFEKTKKQLSTGKWLIITWGTAIVYESTNNNEIVANCHKSPQNKFTNYMLSQEEIVVDFEKLLSLLPKDMNILLTVSPVRHLKESFELNNVSKSILRVACHALVNAHKNVHYFPSYELMMDDLRDYRFYKSDMLHPNEDAVNYIWKKFTTTLLNKSALDFIEEWRKVMNSLNHRPFHPQSAKHQQFIRGTIKKLELLANQVDVTNEIAQLKSNLTT